MGRKSDYTPELAEEICVLIADGKTLEEIAAMDGMPDKCTIIRWTHRYPEFDAHYDVAMEAKAEADASKIIQLSDEAIRVAETEEDPKKANVRVHALQNKIQNVMWNATKLRRRKYGDKIQAEVSGPNGKPIEAAITVQFVRPGAPEK